jgi:hypothetical protein
LRAHSRQLAVATGDVCIGNYLRNVWDINAFNYVHLDRGPQDWARFVAEGGKMHLIVQVTAGVDEEMLVKTLKPLALQRQGEVVDEAPHSRVCNDSSPFGIADGTWTTGLVEKIRASIDG